MELKFKIVKMEVPEGTNIIIGQTHFIKTVEDLYEIIITSVPKIKFGLAFCEASGPCLVRMEGNDEKMKRVAIKNATDLDTGHTFVILLKEAFPINILNEIKNCPEVCSIFCATANPVEVIIAETKQGRGIMGVIDGFRLKGIEKEEDIQKRKDFLRKIGYKR